MCFNQIVLYFTIIAIKYVYSQDVEETTHNIELAEGEKKMSDNILAILEHFKQPDPIGLPGADIREPYFVPDMEKYFFPITICFKNTAVYGLSKFRIAAINIEVEDMQVQAALTIDRLQAWGNYTITWWSSSKGPYTIDVSGLQIKATAGLGVERDGNLRVQDIVIDLSFKTIHVNFENLGFFGVVVQGMINLIGSYLFDTIKPYVLKEAYTKARTEINKKLDVFVGDMQFSNSISPLDMVILEARKKVRNMGMDPYKVKDYNTSVSVFSITLSETCLTGISSFQRVGNITLKMENKTLIADFEIGTQKLEGQTQWRMSTVGGLISRDGIVEFSVEYINTRIIIVQSLQTKEKPQFRSLDFEVGLIKMRFDGTGTFDYVIEFAFNFLPNLLRYQIMDSIEGPIREKIKQELDEIDVEEAIKQKLYEIDTIQRSEFNLLNFISTNIKEKVYDEDEFFNF